MACIANNSITLNRSCEREIREAIAPFQYQKLCPTKRYFSHAKILSRHHMARIQNSGNTNNSTQRRDLSNVQTQIPEAALSLHQSPTKPTDVDTHKATEEMISESQETGVGSEKEDSSHNKDSDENLWKKVGKAKDADEAIAMLWKSAGLSQAPQREEDEGRESKVSIRDCSQIIAAALEEKNTGLVLSILNAMKSSLIPKKIEQNEDVNIYATLIKGLAATLQVSDAISVVEHVSRCGVPVGEEVPFGKVISCPTCKKALAVVQPQHGMQLVPCSKCKYNYELMSGDVINYKSNTICDDSSMIQKSLRFLRFGNQLAPRAVHSFVVRDPSGIAGTLRFATEDVDVPAQEGERVTFTLAAPAIAERQVGPFRMSMRTPRWRPSEPMAITNHVTGTITSLLHAPQKFGSGALFESALIFSAITAFASGEAATNFVDPTLPHMIAASAVAAIVLTGAVNLFVYPHLNQVPQRTIDAMALKQKLLEQHKSLEVRIKALTRAAINEVQMMARMFQLQNKMEAVGEPAYNARIARVIKAREGIYQQLVTRLELIHRYAKVSSMIEIEVEMDVDVLAAEAVGAVERVMEQVEQITEVEVLQEKWKVQAEASNEVERLLNLAPISPN